MEYTIWEFPLFDVFIVIEEADWWCVDVPRRCETPFQVLGRAGIVWKSIYRVIECMKRFICAVNSASILFLSILSYQIPRERSNKNPNQTFMVTELYQLNHNVFLHGKFMFFCAEKLIHSVTQMVFKMEYSEKRFL